MSTRGGGLGKGLDALLGGSSVLDAESKRMRSAEMSCAFFPHPTVRRLLADALHVMETAPLGGKT